MTIIATCSHGCEWFEVVVLNDDEKVRVEAAHHRRHHGAVEQVPQLASVVGWTEALKAARDLADAGREFTVYDLPDVADHKTRKGQLGKEIHRLGIAHPVRYDRSRRPGTKASAVAVWHADWARCMDPECAQSWVEVAR